MFLIYEKLNQSVADKTFKDIKAFFLSNPRRRICRTDLFSVRRGHISEDILKHCESGVTLAGKTVT